VLNDFVGQSGSCVLPGGLIRFKVSGQPLQSDENESNVLKTLAEAVGAVGWRKKEKLAIERGEDGFVKLGEDSVAVQVVSVPMDTAIRQRVATGECVVEVPVDAVASWIAQAIQRKTPGGKCIPRTAPSLILAIDARHWGQVVNAQVLDEFHRQMPGAADLVFRAIWLVGGNAAGSRRLAP